MAGIQFNSKDAKGFRTTLEKYYNARHAIADFANKRNDNVKSCRTIIANNDDDLKAITDGTYTGMRTADEIKADTVAMTAKLDGYLKDYTDAVEKQKSAIDKANELYTVTLHNAASAVVASFGNDIDIWRSALADMLRANGLTDATAENVSRFDYLVTSRSNTSKKVYKTNCLVGVGSKAQSARNFLDTLSEYLVTENIISPFKHKYIPVSERNKKDK